MAIEVRFSHKENTPSPMATTLGGMMMEVKLEHEENA